MNGLLTFKNAPKKSARGADIRRVNLPGVSVDALALWKQLPSPWRFWWGAGWRFHRPAASDATWLAWGAPLWTFRPAGKTDVPATFQKSLATFMKTVKGDVLPPHAGAVGFWSYEAARYFDPALKKALGAPRGDESLWAVPAVWARLDKNKTTLWCPRDQAGRWEKTCRVLSSQKAAAVLPPTTAPLTPALETDYKTRVRQIKRHISRGDIYQANLSHTISLPWGPRQSSGDFFAALNAINPSPYAALMDFPGLTLISGSPELLLRVDGDRLETRPIAGTRPRGKSPAADKRLSGELLLNPKERAEHIMLLDLERNDLGRVCRPGSVTVTEQLALERYSHVTHIVSQVEGRLKKSAGGFDALAAVFPGGTITGCPNIECMKILSKLERGPRGPFYGSAGWISPSGDMELNILIRTAQASGGRLRLRVGAGIVADSHPRREWRETLHKARALLSAYRTQTGKEVRLS
jgi:anthranilate/para-aminobenzoate synthase component I